MIVDPIRLAGDKQGKVAVAQCNGSSRIDKLADFAGLGCADNYQLDAVALPGILTLHAADWW